MKTLAIFGLTVTTAVAQWPQPKSPAVPEADGYVELPNAALSPSKDSAYRAISMLRVRLTNRRNCFPL